MVNWSGTGQLTSHQADGVNRKSAGGLETGTGDELSEVLALVGGSLFPNPGQG